MSISNSTMLAHLSIGMWNGYKLDKERSAQVTEDAGAAADSARVNKHLVPRESLSRLVSAANKLRIHFYSQTLPWSDNGDRLLPRLNYVDFMQKHNVLKEEFTAEVDQFCTLLYPSIIAQARFRMGAMFVRDDYPHESQLRQKFDVSFELLPVATAGDFRVELDEKQADAIRADIEARTSERIAKAAAEPMRQMLEAVKHFHVRLKALDESEAGEGRKAPFYAKRIEDLAELAKLMPKLNFTNDPAIDAMCQRVYGLVQGQTPKTLKDNPEERTATMLAAEDIMADIGGFMRAFDKAA